LQGNEAILAGFPFKQCASVGWSLAQVGADRFCLMVVNLLPLSRGVRMNLAEGERMKQLNELIQAERDPKRLSALTEQLLQVLERARKQEEERK